MDKSLNIYTYIKKMKNIMRRSTSVIEENMYLLIAHVECGIGRDGIGSKCVTGVEAKWEVNGAFLLVSSFLIV